MSTAEKCSASYRLSATYPRPPKRAAQDTTRRRHASLEHASLADLAADFLEAQERWNEDPRSPGGPAGAKTVTAEGTAPVRPKFS